MTRYILGLFIAFFITSAGCTSYKAMEMPNTKLETMPALRTKGPVVVGADPYLESDRQYALFDADFNKVGVLAIQVLVQNKGSHRLLVRRSEIVLELPDGSRISPARKTDVVDLVTPEPTVVLPPNYHAGVVAYGAAEANYNMARADRLSDYRRKELKDRTLKKGESSQGFVYFIVPLGINSINETTLNASVLDVDDANKLIVRLPLGELTVEMMPPKPD